ncbi:hypothetical protein GE061_009415 [Apolygus lucorum]|uniref:Mesoderm induction early response protein 1 n=1 Tax=Apolygus lucorum TaxID=248454 RepID=A0A8S9Y050_APOLU|nr:hypothetical protein GE061_009415 [Apolygus lucorum]
MMVHEYDDERTLEEEEALGPLEDPSVELSSLEKEGNMPIEDLMAMYGYNDADTRTTQSSEEMNGEKPNETEVADKKSPSGLEQIYNEMEPDGELEPNTRATRYGSRAQSEEEEDYDYAPDEEEERKKTIMVGSDYQAYIPDIMCKYDDALPYENQDKLVWDPSNLNFKEIEDYLIKVQEPPNSTQSVTAIPTGKHTRDDEEALYLLLQCGHNIEEALRRRKINPNPPSESMSLWSEEECRHFETGLRSFGKDFRQIQMNKVRTRSVGELVQFYYLWKKTERHDIFANKARLEKKKYSLHPGITDYMDRFLEEQEVPLGSSASGRDRSTSPNIHSLLYGDPKWPKRESGKTEEPETEVKKEVKEELDTQEKPAEQPDPAPTPCDSPKIKEE